MGYRVYTCIVQSLALLFGLIVSELTLGVRAGDVLDLLQFVNKTNSDIRYIAGTDPSVQAVYLQETTRNLLLPDTIASEALMRVRNNDDVTFLATVKQTTGNHGSIFSFSAGHFRFLELDSNGEWDEITLYYIHDQRTYTETFPFRLANNHWHKIALTLSGNHVTLYINCTKQFERMIQSLDRHQLTGSHLNLYVGQRNQQTTLFMGAIQELKLVTRPNGYLDQCPARNTSEFQNVQNSTYTTNTLFQNLTMKNKTVDCRRVECPPLTCDNPVTRDGECCPVCLTNCYYLGDHYQNGATFTLRRCVTCKCENGSMMCTPQDPDTCPKLDCEDTLHVNDQCCPICRGTDFCSLGHNCHENATCVNLATRYACQCQRGFQGNGTDCQDINECLSVGGRDGNHCHKEQECENTIGSYQCRCISGHPQKEDLSCSDLSSGQRSLLYTTWLSTWTKSVIMAWLCLLINYVHR